MPPPVAAPHPCPEIAEATIKAGDKPKAAELLKVAYERVDKTAAKGTMHKNTASRRKSLLQRRFNALQAAGK